MALQKDEAIVLIKRTYGESDRILTLFTVGAGKISAIAKGGNKSQKRFANTLEPFNHVRVEYFEKYGKGMVRIENADILETNSGIEKTLKRACTAAFFTEFVNRLTKEREKHDGLFQALRGILKELKDVEYSYDDVLHHQLKILGLLGFMPNFDACVYCGKDMTGYVRALFSRERGGILCSHCARSLPYKAYPDGVIARLALLRDNGGRPSASEGFVREAQDIMEGFTSFHLDVEFRSYKILKNLFLKE
jgi:DNA repair protein RecO (recombination protein O)